jgi:hypothetical protein
MIINDYVIRINTINPVLIMPFGDVHKGSISHDSSLWERSLKRMESDKSMYCIGTGDYVDDDRPTSREIRRRMYADRLEALDSSDERYMTWLDKEIVPDFKRISKRCMGLLDGDHYRIFRNGMTSTQYICNKSKIPYLGDGIAYVILSIYLGKASRITYRILARHGKGACSTIGGDVNKLIRVNANFAGDLFIGGHTHKEMVYIDPQMYPCSLNKGCGRILKEWPKAYARTGSCLTGYLIGKTTYVEREEYAPVHRGFPIIHIELGKPQWNNSNLTVVDVKAGI